MFEGRHSLNPHAKSFIPNTKSEGIREMAAKSVTELWEKKKATGEKTVTNEEIARLVGRFISVGFKDLTDSNKVKIQNYFNNKLLSSKNPAVRPISDLCKIRSKLTMKRPKLESFDAPKIKTSNVPFLLVAFWGLYRHEQAQRPLLSLTYRPDVLKDKIWSIDSSDNKLWNQFCVSKVCECPPIFGYSIPSNFFGVSFNLHSCSEQKIHLNHYPESTEGNEIILTNNWQHVLVEEQPFEDVIADTNNGADVEILTNQFHTTISGICSLLAKFAEEPDSGIEDNEVDEIDYFSSLWDDSDTNISYVPISQQNRETLLDDNDHPLLKVSKMCLEQEVPLEVKEMIRKSLSPKKDKLPSVVDEDKNVCNPPCSIWCYSVNEGKSLESVENTPSQSEDPKNFEGVPMVDLVPLEQLDSQKKVEPVTIALKPALNFCGNKRKSNQSLSFGDWDPYYYETKFDGGVTAHTSNLTKSKDSFTFLEKDPAHSKSFLRRESWEDSDSGFVSLSSSEDDLFGGVRERNSIWKLVNSEDSLWKPLPECVETNNTKMHFPYKRAPDFRCKRSVS